MAQVPKVNRDPATFIGIFGAFAVMIAAILAGGGVDGLLALTHVPSFLVTIGGSTFSAFTAFSVDQVLMTGGDKVQIGQPYIAGASVDAEVTEHSRGPKLIIFKMRRRHKSRRTRGFRSTLTTLRIAKINA